MVSGLNVSANGVEWLQAPEWENLDWLWHGFATRKGGVSLAYLGELGDTGTRLRELGELNLGFTAADSQENVHENRFRFAGAVSGSRGTPLAVVRQVHSNLSVVLPDEGTAGSGVAAEADGIMTCQAGLLLGIQTADCIPVLVADPRKRAVAAFHAGWRGTVERIVELGVAQMRQQFGSDPVDLIAAIGPGIGACCYTVGAEVLARFTAGFSYAEELFGRHGEDLYLNLAEANRRQLLATGLAADSIATVGGCTACQPEYFYSHRASGGHAGRMMAVIGVR